MEEKKTYEKPTVQKVEFDFKTRIAASSCVWPDIYESGFIGCNLNS